MISRTDRGGTLQSDMAAVTSKTSAKMRLGLGQQNRLLTSGLGKNERPEEEERGSDLRARMREKRSYAARVLGDLVGGERKRKSEPQEDEEGEKGLVRKRKTDTSRDEDRKRQSDPIEEEVERLMRKRRSDHKDNEEKVKRPREVSPGKIKKKKSKDKKEKKEKKSKKSKRSHSPNEDSQGSDRNALQMAQEFSKEYEPIRSRKMKVKKTEHDDDDLGLGLSLDTSLETSQDHGHKHEQSEASVDVMKDLDDFLND